MILVVHALPQYRVKRLGLGFFGLFTWTKKRSEVRQESECGAAWEVSSWTPAAYEAHHEVRDDLWVQIMTDDDPYFWHRQEQTAVWRMPLGTRPAWVRSRDGLFVHVETGRVLSSLSTARRVERTWIKGCDKAGAAPGGQDSLHGAVRVWGQCKKTALEFVKFGALECRCLGLLGAWWPLLTDPREQGDGPCTCWAGDWGQHVSSFDSVLETARRAPTVLSRHAQLKRSETAKQQQHNNNNSNPIWRGSALTGEEPPRHSGELNHALSQVGGPTQTATLLHVVKTPHLHGGTDYGENIDS